MENNYSLRTRIKALALVPAIGIAGLVGCNNNKTIPSVSQDTQPKQVVEQKSEEESWTETINFLLNPLDYMRKKDKENPGLQIEVHNKY